jgi:NAD(P)-dependent dehydrogenase (short-subunit alcohol dehydrogenase family)
VPAPAALRLHGVTALITGAASGIGRATAVAFHREGARAMLVDVDGGGLETLVSSLGDRSSACVADLGAPGGAADVHARAESLLGTVDVLVNNAGVSSKTPFPDVDETEWERVFAINVDAPVELALRASAGMIKRRSGCILNISSISGRGGGPSQSVYGVSKGALLGLTREMAMSLAPHSVRVNAALPGVIDTAMVRQDTALDGDPDGVGLAAWIRAAVPVGRIGRAEEVANVLLFLASDEGAAITGALVPVEGGYLSA